MESQSTTVASRGVGVKVSLAIVSVATVLLATIGACSRPAEETVTPSVPVTPAVASPVPAVCPATWTSDRPTPTRTSGPFAPRGAIEAMLCSYPPLDAQTRPVGDVHRLTTGVERIVEYLNGLPAVAKPDLLCPLDQRTEHVVVLGYSDRPPAVVTFRQCSLDQSGQVRYQGDIKKITGFWGVEWNR